jgi:hypothetical protein
MAKFSGLFRRRNAHGTIRNSCGNFIWMSNQNDRMEAIIIRIDDLIKLIEKSQLYGIRIDPIDVYTMGSGIEGHLEYYSPRVCKFLYRMNESNDQQLIALKNRVFYEEKNNWNWISALDCFSLYRSGFSFFRSIYPIKGITLADDFSIFKPEIESGNYIIPGGSNLDDSFSVTLSINDVSRVEGNGRHWEINLNSGIRIELDWKSGIRLFT